MTGANTIPGSELEQRPYQWLIKMAHIRYVQSKSNLFDWIQVIVKWLKWEMKFSLWMPGRRVVSAVLEMVP